MDAASPMKASLSVERGSPSSNGVIGNADNGSANNENELGCSD
jgi:hypothetical protein